jgi:hypothetical protein
MRGHDQHVHTDQDIIVTVCRRIITLLEPETTPQGIRDAEECEANALERYGVENTELDILLSRMYDMLHSMMVVGGVQ